jgi:uncharacterized membrane protein
MNEWTKIRVLHGLIAFVIASVASVTFAGLAFWGSAKWFVYRYPHDGLDGLGALSISLIALAVSWVTLFLFTMKWQWMRAWRKQQAKLTKIGS